MTNRISSRLTSLGSKKLLIPFFTAGYPDASATVDLVRTAEDAGADFVELGIPFSDPMADGPQIQFSSQAALDNGITLAKIMKIVAAIRKRSEIPLIFMGYYNPIISWAGGDFLRAAADSGIDGLIIPDLPIEEANDLNIRSRDLGLSNIYLVAPTSTRKRIRLIDKHSTDFVYAVTVTGVTGTGRQFGRQTDLYLQNLQKTLTKHFVAGFGVSSAEAAKRLCRHASGVVIGSALVSLIQDSKNRPERLKRVARFLSAIRRAI